MDRLTIQRREGKREAELWSLRSGHVMQPIKWEKHRAEATNGTAGWAESEPM